MRGDWQRHNKTHMENKYGKRTMKITSLILTAASAVAIPALAAKSDANRENFEKAISSYQKQAGNLCMGSIVWPSSFPNDDMRMVKSNGSVGLIDEMEALEAAGFVKQSNVMMTGTGWDMKEHTVKAKRFELTEKGKLHTSPTRVKVFDIKATPNSKIVDGAGFCIGRVELINVVKWDMPVKLGEYQEVSVSWKGKFVGLPDWTREQAVRNKLPVLKILDEQGPIDKRAKLKMTSEGWEVISLQ